MNKSESRDLAAIADYYSMKVAQYGATAQGADWRDRESQQVRFRELLRIISDTSVDFSIADLGCGYGSLVDYLHHHANGRVNYIGYDISADMIATAHAHWSAKPGVRFVHGDLPGTAVDYCVASGIFNVRLETPDEVWLEHIKRTLDAMHAVSRRGFSFNCLTSYSDPERMQTYLYYAEPTLLFDWCKRSYARNVALLHDYDLYEFTILVRKSP